MGLEMRKGAVSGRNVKGIARTMIAQLPEFRRGYRDENCASSCTRKWDRERYGLPFQVDRADVQVGTDAILTRRFGRLR